MSDLFEHANAKDPQGIPLSDRMRPRTLDEMVGQAHVLSPDKLLAKAIRADRIPSMILWGPPGTGKTTLAQVVAHDTSADFEPFSAVLGGVPELRKIIARAEERKKYGGRRTILFVDEIHRFNKAQQDALLPHVERGTVVLIGATTENPSFAVNAALLSRARVFRLEPLDEGALAALLRRALEDTERGLGRLGVRADDAAITTIAKLARGDARRALGALELAAGEAAASGRAMDEALVREALADRTLLYDKSGEEHHNVVSAFIKSMRGNDPDAAIYWMMRMLEAGDDPRFVLRRMIIFASEDVGNADPVALSTAVAADAAFARLGMPEGMFAMAQCCTYLASTVKSNASYAAWTAAQEDVREHGPLPVPLKLRNAPTAAMKAWGYGEGYRYPHDEGGHAAGETYLPDALAGRRYYVPREAGFESKLRARLRRLRGEE
ncbi:MAG: replication-associated recombination protein A [Sandaracinaceae bacterium]|nr:replication-associated recombination protein A [Sandaracinaceae bacterium]